MISIAAESPLGADLGLLMVRHTADMHADTPPESIHMMDAAQLAVAGVSFFVMPKSSRCTSCVKSAALACREGC